MLGEAVGIPATKLLVLGDGKCLNMKMLKDMVEVCVNYSWLGEMWGHHEIRYLRQNREVRSSPRHLANLNVLQIGIIYDLVNQLKGRQDT